MDDDEADVKFLKILKHLEEHPEDRTADFDQFIRSLVLSPQYHQSLVERAKRNDKATLDLLLSYARDPEPTPGRTFARKILSEAWRDDDKVH